jgi:shikimate 5-dehydrogenase
MSQSRLAPSRELFGVLGSYRNQSSLQKQWNTYFARNSIDAFFDAYSCTRENLHERLSEMYHFDRRGYIIDSALSEDVLSLLDVVDSSAVKQGSVTVVRNDTGVLTGYLIDVEHTAVENLYTFFMTGEW